MSTSESNHHHHYPPSSSMSSSLTQQNDMKTAQHVNMYQLRHTMIVEHFDRIAQCIPTGVCIQGSAFSSARDERWQFSMNIYPTGSSDDNIHHLSVYVHLYCRAQRQQQIEQAIIDEFNDHYTATRDNDDESDQECSQGELNANVRQRRRYSNAYALLRRQYIERACTMRFSLVDKYGNRLLDRDAVTQTLTYNASLACDAQTGNNWGYRRLCSINEARKCVEQTADGRLYVQCELSVVKQRHVYNYNINHLMPFINSCTTLHALQQSHRIDDTFADTILTSKQKQHTSDGHAYIDAYSVRVHACVLIAYSPRFNKIINDIRLKQQNIDGKPTFEYNIDVSNDMSPHTLQAIVFYMYSNSTIVGINNVPPTVNKSSGHLPTWTTMSNLVDIQVTSQLYEMFTLTHLCNIHIWRTCTAQHALILCTKVWQYYIESNDTLNPNTEWMLDLALTTLRSHWAKVLTTPEWMSMRKTNANLALRIMHACCQHVIKCTQIKTAPIG